jgi:rare lipoprotein A (peptidoglycan hydrolase)
MRKTILIALSSVLFVSAVAVVSIKNSAVTEHETETVNHLILSDEKKDRVVSKFDEPIKVITKEGKTEMFGTASWYDFTFNPDGSSRVCYIDREDCWTGTQFVAAMRDVPRGTIVKVTNLDNRRSVNVRIADYGPDESVFPYRIIDLSSAAFGEIAYLPEGLTEVKLEW